MRTFIFFIFLSLSATLNAQKHYLIEIDSLNKALSVSHDTTKLKILDMLIIRYFSVSEDEKMYRSLRRMESLANKLGNDKEKLKVYYYHGLIKFHKEWRTTEAISNFRQALKIATVHKVGDPNLYSGIYGNLGLIYKNIEMYDSALYYYKRAVSINKDSHLSKKSLTMYINMSRLYQALGNKSKPLQYARKCLDLALKMNDEDALYMGYSAMAEALYRYSPDLAKEYCEKALDLAVKIYGESHSNTAYLILLLSKCYYQLGNFEKALYYSRQEYLYLLKTFGPTHPKLLGSYISLGDSYSRLNIYDSAEYFYGEALQCTKNITGENNRLQVIALQKLAEHYVYVDNTSMALHYINQAIELKIVKDKKKAELLHVLGDITLKRREYFESLSAYEKAISLLANISSEGSKDPNLNQLSNQTASLLLMQKKALVKAIVYDKTEKLEHLVSSLNDYQSCDTIISLYRNSYMSDNDRLAFNRSSTTVYYGGVATAHKLYKTYGRNFHKELSFLFAEKSKSNLLYQSITEHHAMRYGMLPDSVLDHEESLKGKIAFYISRINKESEGEKKQDYEDRLFEVKREYENFQQTLEATFPKYYRLKYNSDFLTLSEIQNRLNDETIIEYVLTDDSIYIFLIKRNYTQIFELARPDELDLWLDEFRSSILSKEHARYQEVAYHLYKSLFEPVEQFLDVDDHVVIVPDGKLWHLNFDLLLTRRQMGKPFYDLDYLVKKYTISYANSANHLFMNVDLPAANKSNKCLAFSYSSDSATTSYMDFLVLRDFKHDLPGTREEIRSISKLFPGKYYFGSLASEANFKRESQHYSILHLALHGEVSDTDPLYSKLKFSPANNDSTEDGYLNIYEIYNMNLNSELAVLSACNTGYGKLEKGEGLMSLGRAFQYAGVNSLLLSNWGVPDEVAPALMYDFYRYLKQGMKKSEALRNAKLNYLKSAGIHKSAPFYWGSFVVIGGTSSIEIEGGKPKSWIFALSSIFFFAMVLWVSDHRPVKHLF